MKTKRITFYVDVHKDFSDGPWWNLWAFTNPNQPADADCNRYAFSVDIPLKQIVEIPASEPVEIEQPDQNGLPQ